MLESKGRNINRITRVLLLIITFTLFLTFFFLFNSSFHQYEHIEKKTKSLLNTFKESQENIDTVYNKFSDAQHYFRLFSNSLSKDDYSKYREKLFSFKSTIDSLIQVSQSFIDSDSIKYIKDEEYTKIINYYKSINDILDRTISFSEELEYYPIHGESAESLLKKDHQLLAHNFNTLYQINQVIRTLNHDRIQIKKSIIEKESQDIFAESSEFRFKTFLCLIFIFLLICIIVYYQFFSSYYKRKLNIEQLYARKLADKKSDIFTQITHEIRTPINSLIGILEILKKKKNLYNEEDRLLVDSAYTSITNTSKTINDILNQNTANSTESTFHTFDIEDIVVDIIELHQSQAKIKNIKLTYTIDEKCPSIIFTDEFKLKQILNNLISNAVKYSHRGTVNCIIEILNKSTLVLKIKDDGEGIPIEVQQNIFKKYFTAETDSKYSNGLGLGLFITKNLVESLKGKIRFSSSISNGTIFTVEIPIPLAKRKTIESSIYKTLSDLSPDLSWLIVDDNILNLLYLRQFFSKFPNLKTAKNGIEAIEIIQKHTVDIVITDINMPIMTGDELLVKIKESEKFNHIKVIATSSDNEQVKRLEIMNDCYFDGILTKPFNEKDLLRTIINTLDLH